MVQDEWFKMQVWLLQYLIRDFKESDSAIIDAHDPEVFKLRLVQNDGWDADAKHVSFDPFATICFHAISKRYLEQTSSHLIGKLKSFVVARLSFGKHVKNPLKWTSVVEAAWHDLQGGIKRCDPEALAALELVLDVYNSTPSGLSGLRASMNSTTTARLQSLRCCSLSSTVMAFTLLCLRRTLLLHTQLASIFVTTLQQST